jgi:hypothetical protein
MAMRFTMFQPPEWRCVHDAAAAAKASSKCWPFETGCAARNPGYAGRILISVEPFFLTRIASGV